MKTPLKNTSCFFIYIVLLSLIGRDISLLFQTRFATGIDGYYYVLQINWLLKFGHFYFPTNTPLVLYFLSFLTYIANDTIFAIKFGAIVLLILLYVGVAVFLQTIVKNALLTALGIFLAAFSVLHLYFLSEFLNNLGATAFLIWGAFGIFKMLQIKKKIWIIFALFMLSLSSFCHRSAIWLAIWLFFVNLLAFGVLNYTTKIKQKITFGLMFVFLLTFPIVLTRQSLIPLPESLLSELSPFPQNPFHSLVLMESLMLLMVSLTTILILFLKPKILQRNLSGLILLSIVFWSLLVTLNPFLNHQKGIFGIVVRFDALAYLQAAIAIPLLLSLIISYSKKLAIVFTLSFLPLLFLRSAAPLPVGLRPEYLQSREKLVRELPLMGSKICQQPFIVARHGEQFLVTEVLKIPSQQKPPLENRFQCVFWLIRQNEADYQIIFENSVTSSDGEFTLVEDSEIKRSFDTITDEERRRLLLENHHLEFLTK